ncbi:hypothetical protein [Streptomyces syringium]|uniref:hypothetical protein n=1 Tax=Streptomyces syringium TaxID=76729 RepID=UPI0033A1C6D2
MAERNSWAVSDPSKGVVTTEDARLAVSSLMQAGPSPVTARDGLRPGPGRPGLVAAAAPTPDKTVTVQPFQMFMRSSRGTGSYVQTLDAVKSIDLLTKNPADSSNPRYDLIVAQQSDTFYGDPANSFAVQQIVGSPSATPVNPRVPGSPDFFPLARVRIPAGATSIDNSMIDDLRPGFAVALGGLAPVRGAEERDGTTAYPGAQVYRQDRRWVEVHDGAAWRVANLPVGSSAADLAAAVTAPALGQLAFGTGDNLLYRWDGSAWVGSVAAGGTGAARHEARYEVGAGQGQSFAAHTDTRVQFPTAVHTTPDVTATDNSSVFTLNRAGLWHITASQKLVTEPTEPYDVYFALVDSTNSFRVRYANVQISYTASSYPGLTCTTVGRFGAGAQVCAILWMTKAGPAHDLTWPSVNNIALTWLRA